MGKSLGASVGQGGLNKAADVMTVQFLLNCVPVSQGGPPKELAVDGLIGPKTVLAIRQFQTTQFGWCDGRVDPEQYGGMTIAALNTFDPVPDSPPGRAYASPEIPVAAGMERRGERTIQCEVRRGDGRQDWCRVAGKTAGGLGGFGSGGGGAGGGDGAGGGGGFAGKSGGKFV